MATLTRSEPILNTRPKPRAQRIKLYVAKNGVFWLMALPGLVLLFLFAYAPLPGIIIAFKNYKFNLGLWGSEWLGLKNFEFLIRTPLATRALLNTLFAPTVTDALLVAN